ncbi:hypothetical protein N7457_007218, partial [Penicillium paradoxum]|uniref:uncharacterized protein n=1 Tax=Penicillium paradoxum TaxID=176176 RepID=UPI002548B86E
PFSPLTARSILEYSRARTTLSFNPLPDTTSSLHGGYPPIKTHLYVGREYATRAAKGKRGNIIVRNYDSLPRSKYIIPLSSLFN